MRKVKATNAKIAVCITTHMRDYPRRGGGNVQEHVDFFKWSIDRYLSTPHGVGKVDLFIMDTGSKDPQYLDYIYDLVKEHKNVYLLETPNRCAYLAGIKHVMEGQWNIVNKYNYFMFHIDDSIDPQHDNWARELVDQFHDHKEDKKIIGISHEVRHLRSREFQPWGRELEGHTQVFIHGPLYFMDRRTLTCLREGWNKQCYSEDLTLSMEELAKYENMDYVYLKESNCSFTHQYEQWSHIGNPLPAKHIDVMKEHELNVRLYYLGIKPIRYTGSGIRYHPVSDRIKDGTDPF